MNKQDILDRLRENERALRERGVTLACSGRVRVATIDIMIDTAPETVQDVYAYVELKNYIAGLFAGTVDVVDREALKSNVRPAVTADAVSAFWVACPRGSGCSISVTTSGLRAPSSKASITTLSATIGWSFMR